jgi:molybdate transport system substrate-binding protein
LIDYRILETAMPTKIFSLILLLALLGAACTPQGAAPTSQPTSLTVLAAASLLSPFQEIGRQFEADHPGVQVQFNFSGSQALAQQLDQGAPADVFASASLSYMEAAVKSKRVSAGSSRSFASNQLVVIFPSSNPAGLLELKDLARPGLKLDLAASAVPVGKYSLDFLDQASRDPAFGPGFKETVLKNVVSYEENVKAVLTKVSLGEADAGIVYTSDLTGAAAAKVNRLEIPAALNVTAIYPIAPILNSPSPALARAFMDLVLSPTGQAVLARYGFQPAGPE